MSEEPQPEEPQPVMMVATCRTPDCPMDGVPVTAPFFPNADPPIFSGWCARCDRPITDIVPVSEETSG